MSPITFNNCQHDISNTKSNPFNITLGGTLVISNQGIGIIDQCTGETEVITTLRSVQQLRSIREHLAEYHPDVLMELIIKGDL